MSLQYKFWGMVLGVGGFLIVGISVTAYNAFETTPVTGIVEDVSWACNYRTISNGPQNFDQYWQSQHGVSGTSDCSQAPQFVNLKQDTNQLKVHNLEGTATIKFRYQNENDPNWYEGQINVDGSQPEFYKASVGQKIYTRVDRSDSTKFSGILLVDTPSTSEK